MIRISWSSLLIILLVAGGCTTVHDPSDRPSDGLLDRPDLQLLVDLQTERDGAALVEYLGDDDPTVRARAAFALGSVQHPIAANIIQVLLDDRDEGVRADAIFAIGQSSADSSLVEDILIERFLSERNLTVRRRYLEAFGKIGGTSILRSLVDMDLESKLSPDLALSIARFGIRGIHSEAAVRALAGYLQSPDPLLRRNAAYYFGRMTGTDSWKIVADEVRAALDSYGTDDEAAMHLVLGLGRLEDPVDSERLVRRLEGADDWRVRANAGRALGSLASEVAPRAALLSALDDPSIHVSVYSAGSLAEIDDFTREELDRIERWIGGHEGSWQTIVALLPVLAGVGEGDFVMEWVEALSEDQVLLRSRGLSSLAMMPGDRVFDFLATAARSDDAGTAASGVEALSRRWRRERRSGADPRPYYALFSQALARRDLATAFAAAPSLADSLFEPLGSVTLLLDTYRKMEAPVDVEPMTAILGALGRIGGDRVERFLRETAGDPAHPVLGEGAGAALDRMGISDQTGIEGVTARTAPNETAPAVIDWEYLSEKGVTPQLRLETERGEVVIRFLTEEAPLTVQTILRFAEEGLYDGIAFHRVVPNFVVQGGDFERQDGMGGPGFVIRSEFTRIPYERGVIGMASAGKDTEGSQYFITHSMQPHLDGRYTAFGHVIAGMDVVDSILEGDRVVRATVYP
ncbi:peptidylprolyl isomerase [Gemmatimonadota bacterium]